MDDVESLLFPYKHFYNQQLVPTNLRNIWREGLCPDLISTLDSDLKERIPGVRRDAPAWLTQHLTAEQSWADWGERTMVGVCPALGRTAQVIPAMHPAPAWHMSTCQ